MFIKIKRGWELPESAATPEGVYLRRRDFLAAAEKGQISLAAAGLNVSQSTVTAALQLPAVVKSIVGAVVGPLTVTPRLIAT